MLHQELRGYPKVRAQHQAGTRRQDESLVPLDAFLQTQKFHVRERRIMQPLSNGFILYHGHALGIHSSC